MTVTLCTSGAVKLKAGANASLLTNDQYEMLINEAESYINVAVKEQGVDFVAIYSTLSDNKKKILEDCASSFAAIGAINYDMSGFTSRQEATTMLNVNWAKANAGLDLLKNKQHSDYLRGV